MRSTAVMAMCLAGAFILGLYVSAHDGDTAKIHGCVQKDGTLRVIAATSTCKTNETPLDWNIIGPQGPVGLTGPQGSEGVPGPIGPPGNSGGLKVFGSNGAFAGLLEDSTRLRILHPTHGWFDIRIFRSGILEPAAAFSILVSYTGPNCSGDTFVANDKRLVRLATVVGGDTVYAPSDVPPTTVVQTSYRLMDSSGLDHDCISQPRTVDDVVPPVTFPLTDLDLPPAPYHVGE
jgi:hypothetical protein